MSVHQTALVVALLYLVLALVFMPILYLLARLDPDGALPAWAIVVGPVLYAGLGYVFTALGCAVYNLIAGWVGGVEFTLEEPARSTERATPST